MLWFRVDDMVQMEECESKERPFINQVLSCSFGTVPHKGLMVTMAGRM